MSEEAGMTVALFCGSRGWTDRDQIRLDIEWLPDAAIVVEGGARGADRIAREEALRRGLHVATVNALWDRYGKSAGARRNTAMLRLATEVYAYNLGTPGTNHMIALAQREGLPVHVRFAESTKGQTTRTRRWMPLDDACQRDADRLQGPRCVGDAMNLLGHYTIYVRANGSQCSSGEDGARQVEVVPANRESGVEYHRARYAGAVHALLKIAVEGPGVDMRGVALNELQRLGVGLDTYRSSRT